MAKFWRSGMIDKKVVKEREEAEYINKLERIILELTREEEPRYATFYTSDNRSFKREIPREKPLTPAQSAKKWGEGIVKMFANEYDEVRVGDNVLLDFNKQFICKTPKTPVKDAIIDSYSYWMRKNADKRCKADIAFSERIKEVEDENNTRTLRQEE